MVLGAIQSRELAIDVDLDYVLTFQRIRRLGIAWGTLKKQSGKISLFNASMFEVGETYTAKTSSSSLLSTIQYRRILSSAMTVVDQECNQWSELKHFDDIICISQEFGIWNR